MMIIVRQISLQELPMANRIQRTQKKEETILYLIER